MPIDGLQQKYIVFKKDDWEASPPTNSLPPDDYFVIRSQDVFGASALHGYAHIIQSNLEVSRLQGREQSLTDDERTRLQELADTLVDVATQWQTVSSKKIPD